MESIYSKVKSMPNASPGLLNFLRKNTRGEIWSVGKDGETLKDLKNKPLTKANLKFGSPDNKILDKGEVVKGRVFDGYLNLRCSMFSGRGMQRGYLVGLGKRGKGVWMVNVTDKVIEGLNNTGACYLSEPHCKLELTSPRIKTCKFCNRKLYKKIVIKKHIEWNER